MLRGSHNFYQVLIFYLILGFCYGHYDPAYMRRSDDGFKVRKTWMKEIPDDVLLSELALPGTHESSAFDDVNGYVEWLKSAVEEASFGLPDVTSLILDSIKIIYTIIMNDINTFQCLHFKNQLDVGIRVFDIRIWHRNDKFLLVQGERDLKLTFDQFLFTVTNFLMKNPSETVLIILSKQKESYNIHSSQYVLNEYLNVFGGDKFFLRVQNSHISLGEARGKFIFLVKHTDFSEFGLNYFSGSFDIMDSCHLSTNWDLYYKKWEPVKGHLEKAANGNKNDFYLNYLNGYGGSFPYFVVSGRSSPSTGAPRLSTGLTTLVAPNTYPDFPRKVCLFSLCSILFEGTNILSRDRINSYNMKTLQRSVGIIITNFPGDSLIEAIIQNNNQLINQ